VPLSSLRRVAILEGVQRGGRPVCSQSQRRRVGDSWEGDGNAPGIKTVESSPDLSTQLYEATVLTSLIVAKWENSLASSSRWSTSIVWRSSPRGGGGDVGVGGLLAKLER
jgi:hypothetical protein